MAVKTKVLHLRVSPEEAAALDTLANTLGVKKSEILRRHLREAVRTGPAYFKDGLADLKLLLKAFGSSQRNLNQIAAKLNSSGLLNEDDLLHVLKETQSQVKDIRSWAIGEIKAAHEKTLNVHDLRGAE